MNPTAQIMRRFLFNFSAIFQNASISLIARNLPLSTFNIQHCIPL